MADGLLQWGRALGGAEGDAFAGLKADIKQASMGPRFGGRGRGSHRSPALKACHGFNGAALWGARKGQHQVYGRAVRDPASMGPRFGGRGRGTSRRSGAIHHRMLQWGRALGGAEGAGCMWSTHRASVGSMGPRFGGRGRRRLDATVSSRLEGVQWGRALGGAEGGAPREINASRANEFNGAALWGARKGVAASRRSRVTSALFNGAALWGARKGAGCYNLCGWAGLRGRERVGVGGGGCGGVLGASGWSVSLDLSRNSRGPGGLGTTGPRAGV